MQTLLVYGCVLDGLVTAIGEVGISGLRSTHACESKLGIARGAQRQHPVNSGIVVNNFISLAPMLSFFRCPWLRMWWRLIRDYIAYTYRDVMLLLSSDSRGHLQREISRNLQ
jgi:hypothetical protein